ncbi:helix-turn-helix transcriptional regulator [Pasteurella multocida]
MNTQNSICINIQLQAPYVTIKEYARITGTSESNVNKMVQKGILPIKPKLGLRGTVFINMIALAKEAAMQQ